MAKKKPVWSAGERVIHESLGAGQISKSDSPEILAELGLVSVLFDTRPNVAYNCGQNPTAVSMSKLQAEKTGEN